MADLRRVWITKRQPFMANHLGRLAFIDETSVKTNMTKTTGWAPRGQRFVDYAPFGHWRTQTFIGALRHDRLDAPWVISGAMNSEMFNLYVETQLAPTLREGDVVILPSHRCKQRLPGNGQPVEPQKSKSGGGLAQGWRLVPVSPAVQPRSQPH